MSTVIELRNAIPIVATRPGQRLAGIGLSGVVAAAAVVGAGSAGQAAVVFSDTFATSTLNAPSPAAPTTSSTNYQVLSSKNATGSSIAPGSLQINMVATSSGFAEIQALFASAPVSLANPGDFVRLTMTFTASGINLSGNATFNVGLYNSGGSVPIPGANLNNAQLDDNPGTYATGGAEDWLGYVGRVPVEGNASVIYTRPAQTETSNEAQDVLFANAGGGAFDNPTGANVGTGGTGETFASDTTYTLVYQITNNGSGQSFSLDLNNGAATISGVDAAPLATTFDAMAFGYRGLNNTAPGHSLNVGSILIESNVIVPEPASIALVWFGGLLMVHRWRRRP